MWKLMSLTNNVFSCLVFISNHYANSAPVWFEPKSLVIMPDLHKQHAVLTCHASPNECGQTSCVYEWRKGSVAFDGNPHIDIVDRGKSLLMKAPISESQHGGAYTCFVRKDGQYLGEAVTVVKFKGKDHTDTSFRDLHA